MDQVIKTTVFLSDMNNFGAMNEVYATFFGEGSYPARSAVEVARQTKKKRKQQKRKVLSAKQSRNRKTGFDNRGTSKTHNWR